MDSVMFINDYRDDNKGVTLLGLQSLGKTESSRKYSLIIDRKIKNIEIGWCGKSKVAAKVSLFFWRRK